MESPFNGFLFKSHEFVAATAGNISKDSLTAIKKRKNQPIGY